MVLSPTKSTVPYVLPEIKMTAVETDVALIISLYVADVGIKAATRHYFKYVVVKGKDRAFAMDNTW
jgi:hypothetical protein